VILVLSDSEKQAWARIERDLRSDPDIDQAAGRSRAELHRAGRWTAGSVLEASGHAPSARRRTTFVVVMSITRRHGQQLSAVRMR
jgi:hypothetical protein